MSRVRPRRTPRAITPAGADDCDVCALADLSTGHSGRIIGIDPGLDAGTAGRLHDLGFAPDADVTVLRRAPLGDPVLFAICSYEVALRAAQARWVRVRRLP